MTSVEECQSTTMSDSALARKRRRELLQKQRALAKQGKATDTGESQKRKRPEEDEECDEGDFTASDGSSSSSECGDETPAEKPKPHITGIKKQARYEPGVPMTKKELVAWRKEARRVRNRLSAAESRKKTRTRIEELEQAMGDLQKKYDAAMKHIVELETMNVDLQKNHHSSRHHFLVSSEPGLHVHDGVVSPLYSPSHTIEEPPEELPSPFMLSDYHPPDEGGDSCQMDDVNNKNQQQHIIEMISRPHARVKITP